ncbi:hypothetical protein LAZ67_X000556, partial [Cordylochernes scorpioides]
MERAMKEEYSSLLKNGTWELVDPPKNKNIIGNKWVFRKKFRADGSIERYKARLVAKGYSQKYGIDYQETFAPVCTPQYDQNSLALAVEYDLLVHQMDVQSAFLNGDVKEEIYMTQPENFESKKYPRRLLQRILIYSITSLVDNLGEIGAQVPEDFLVILLLCSLPESYEGFRTAIETRDELPKLETLKVKIIEEDQRQREMEGTSSGEQNAFFGNPERKTTNSTKPPNRKEFKFNCYYCGKKGHKAADCWSKRNTKRNNTRMAAYLGIRDEIILNVDEWCLDSGATAHMCCLRKTFSNVRETEPIAVKLANDQSIEALGTGTVELENTSLPDPKDLDQALSSEDSHLWKGAMKEEYSSLLKNGTWELVDPPKNKNIIGNKWVFRKKFRADGSIERYKARLVAKGYPKNTDTVQRGVDGSISLDQERYIEELLEKYEMKESKPISTPMDPNYKVTKISPIDGENKKSTKELYGYVDADWGGNLMDRKSHSGFVFYLAGGPIAWESKKQQTVSLSSTESEYIALCEAGKEAVHIRMLLDELGFGEILEGPTVLKTDNQGARQLTRNPVYHARTKHIDIKWHYIRDIYGEGLVEVVHTPTQENVADIFTKSLTKNKAEVIDKNGDILYESKRTGDKFEVEGLLIMEIVRKAEVDDMLWHQRLAHVNFQKLKEMYDNSTVLGMKILHNIKGNCESCTLGKIHRKSYKSIQYKQSENILDLWHTDIVGPLNNYFGYKYFITIVDDYSNFTFVIPIANKSQTADSIINLIIQEERQTGKKLKRIRNDNGGEYVSNYLKRWLSSKGIKQEFTTAYTPESKGPFLSFLFKLNVINDPTCECRLDVESPEHLLLTCPLTNQI